VPRRDKPANVSFRIKEWQQENTHRIAQTCEYKSKTNDSNEHQSLSHNLTRSVELGAHTYNMKLLVGVLLVEKNRSVECKWILPEEEMVS
jgi:hypothetical protein